MFIDNRVNLDFVKTNQNIVVMEDSLPQAIKLIYLDNGFIQKTINNITVSFVRYSGKINSKNIIKYNDSYFTNVYNSVLKDYENHLNELVKDIKYFEMNEINKRKAAQAQTTSTTITTRRVEPSNNYDNFANPQISERCRNRWYAFVGVVIIIIIIVLICTGDIDLSNFGQDTDDDDDYYYDDDVDDDGW